MLSDCLDDFVTSSGEPDADLPALLAEFELQLKHYSDKAWGYSPHVFPLLRKAFRGYVSGKLSREALEAVYERVLLCYFCGDGSEKKLIEDLRGYVRAKPSNDLRAVVAQMLSNRKAAAMRPEQRPSSLYSVQHFNRESAPVKLSDRAATTATRPTLRLVR